MLLLLVLRSKKIRCDSIRREEGCFVLFCDSFSDVERIFDDAVMSASRMINCDPVMQKDLKKMEVYY